MIALLHLGQVVFVRPAGKSALKRSLHSGYGQKVSVSGMSMISTIIGGLRQTLDIADTGKRKGKLESKKAEYPLI